MAEIIKDYFHVYGLAIGLAIAAGFQIAGWMGNKLYAQDKAWKQNLVWEALAWILVPALVGARVYHLAGLWDYYRDNPGQVWAVGRGGMGIYGGLLGGGLGLLAFSKKIKFSFNKLADLAAFSLPISQAIGRWGNFFNQELYGKPATAAGAKFPFWAVFIEPQNRVSGYESYGWFQPLFLFESLWSIFIFLLLLLLFKKEKLDSGKGAYFAVYLILYGGGRFYLESLRLERWIVAGVDVNQAVSAAVATAGFLFCLSKRRRSVF